MAEENIEMHTVKCAKCNEFLSGEGEELDSIFSCPKCGISDTHENIIKEVVEFVGQKSEDAVSDMLKDSFSGIKGMTYTETPGTKKDFRFVIDFELKI